MSIALKKRRGESGVNNPNIPAKVMKTDYNLNLEKALWKKLEAAHRVRQLEYESTGGGMVGVADAATFELLKEAALKFYSNYPCGKAEIKKTTDKKGKNVVQFVIQVQTHNNESYTLNLYTTTSKMLLNGRDTQVFVEHDLPEIHHIAQNVKFGGQALNLKALNELFIEQLNKLLAGSTAVHSESTITNMKQIKNLEKEEDIQCLKCNRPCRKKASFCTSGEHWIHYNCEKLSPEEIQINENDLDGSYTCKMCRSESAPNEKATRKLTLPAIEGNCNPNLAELILDEESNVENCQACNEQLNDSDRHSCELCNLFFHKTCVIETEQVAVCFNCESSAEHCNDSEVNNSEKQKPPIRTTVSVGRSTCSVGTSCSFEDVSVKLSDIRAREQKLKRWEEDLKLKEKTLTEASKDKTKLNSHIRKLEAEKEENLLTIRTLRDRIDSIELKLRNNDTDVDKITSQSCHKDILSKQNEHLIQSVHDKVTNFILRQIDNQISKLDFQNCDQETKQTVEIKRDMAQQKSPPSGTTDQEKKQPVGDVLQPPNNDVIFVRKDQLPQTLSGPPIQYIPVPNPPRVGYTGVLLQGIDTSKPPPSFGSVQPYRPPHLKRQAPTFNPMGVNKSATVIGQRDTAERGIEKQVTPQQAKRAGPRQTIPNPTSTATVSSRLYVADRDDSQKHGKSQSFLEEAELAVDLK